MATETAPPKAPSFAPAMPGPDPETQEIRAFHPDHEGFLMEPSEIETSRGRVKIRYLEMPDVFAICAFGRIVASNGLSLTAVESLVDYYLALQNDPEKAHSESEPKTIEQRKREYMAIVKILFDLMAGARTEVGQPGIIERNFYQLLAQLTDRDLAEAKRFNLQDVVLIYLAVSRQEAKTPMGFTLWQNIGDTVRPYLILLTKATGQDAPDWLSPDSAASTK